MRRAVRIALALALSSTALTQATQQPTFRTGVDAVSVDVSVMSGTSPVTGLKAADFVLLDNGVRQTIDVVDTQTLPIDVSLVLDTSASEKPQGDGMRRELEKIEAVLGPEDRLEVMTIDTYVHQVFPMLAPSAHPPFSPTASAGLSSIYDAIAAAMLQPVLPNRRHLVVVLTDGYDTISTLDAPAIRDLARRSDAALHIVSAIAAPTVRALNMQSDAKRPELIPVPAIPVDPRPPGPGELPQQCVETGLCEQWSRFWLPFADSSPDLLAEAARSTGGDVHDPGWFANRDLSSIFRQVFDDYRHSYVLRYTPANVARTGWHTLTVRVAAAGAQSYLVRARSGYAIDAAPPASPDHAQLWAAPDHPVSPPLASVVDAYDRADYAAVAGVLNRVSNYGKLIQELKASGNPWPSTPQREAVFVVELATAALYRDDEALRAEAVKLLEKHNQLVRNPLGPDTFERLYYWAQITAAEGTIRPEIALRLIRDAETRCPDEARFHLAHAIALDQQQRGVPAKTVADQTLALYDVAGQNPVNASEAHLRSAMLLHRLGRHDDALKALDAMSPDQPDADLTYLRNLIRGRVQAARNQPNAAATAYRAAIASEPNAQAPHVGLMTALFRLGDLEGAQTVARAIEMMKGDDIDPWWRYWQGDFRFYPAAIDALRKASR